MSTTETPEASAIAERPTTKKLRGPRVKRAELTPEQQELTTKYMALARSIAKPIKLKWLQHRDELDSAAMLALVEAAQAYNPRRGVKFVTFARVRILGALYDIQRYLYNKAHSRHLPNAPREYYYVPGEAECAELLMTSLDAPIGRELESADEVEHWLEALPARNAQACRELYVGDKTMGEAAGALGCVKSRVCTLHAEALNILRESPDVREAALAIGLDVSRN
jgi:RNA polymerase sigma factor (sigma-70 family)